LEFDRALGAKLLSKLGFIAAWRQAARRHGKCFPGIYVTPEATSAVNHLFRALLLIKGAERLMNILVIDDDPSVRKSLRLALETMGHKVVEAAGSTQAEEQLGHGFFDVAFLDLRLGKEDGLAVLPVLLRLALGLAVVVVTAYATIETAVEAMRRGAFDYLPKPFTPNQLRLVLDRVTRVRRLQSHVEELEEQIRSIVPEADLQTQEPAMRQALEVAFKAAPTEATILLRGESGTGKGVLARAIHARSPRLVAPFMTVHCPSLSAELLESELFGHIKGAFTGAVQDTLGKIAAAEGGTLFLDEIGDLPLPLQPKLLRLLQEKRYERVGETRTRVCDLRILAATNRDLQAAVATGGFREDLLYRLNVIEVVLPSLRQRRKDVLPLAEHLLQFFARQTAKPISGFTEEAKAALLRYPWPGNVRELRNAIERGVILAPGPEIGIADLPTQVGSPFPTRGLEVGGSVTLDALEAEHIRRVLATTPTMEQAATILGIDPSTLYRKRKRYGL
jgi:NtrC-family two-component system response regulator AlgB